MRDDKKTSQEISARPKRLSVVEIERRDKVRVEALKLAVAVIINGEVVGPNSQPVQIEELAARFETYVFRD